MSIAQCIFLFGLLSRKDPGGKLTRGIRLPIDLVIFANSKPRAIRPLQLLIVQLFVTASLKIRSLE